MKYLAFLFTIYVMALSAWPCCGDETGLSSNREDLCMGVTEHQKDNHENPHACSPFFHASTYHAFVAASTVTKAPALIFTKKSSDYADYADAPVILFAGDIWQPPQLV